MKKDHRVRLMLLMLARSFKKSARSLKEQGYEQGALQLKASSEAYRHAARIVKHGDYI